MPRIEGTKVGRDPKGREVWSPIVIVRLGLNGLFVQVLGVDWKKLPAGERGGGAGGMFESRPLELTMSWQSWSVTEEMRVAEPNRLPIVLLGRCDFFSRFVVRFNWHKAPPEFHLDPVAARPHK